MTEKEKKAEEMEKMNIELKTTIKSNQDLQHLGKSESGTELESKLK